MATFDSTKTALSKLLEQIAEGAIQLPEFQRGWVWDDAHIRSLLVSVARSFPIGCVMLLETGGSTSFKVRPIEGITVATPPLRPVENLILDGQQRLTSLTQVMKLSGPVLTRDDKDREVSRYYYINIEMVLKGRDLEEAILAVDESRTLRTNFGRDVVLDLSTQENEFKEFCFPCSQILNSDAWEEGLMGYDSARFARYMEFRKGVLNAFREYQVPVIQLKKETSKEAVCLVFEKVNTGGVSLSVFELATATYAADGFNLRDDWFGSSENKVVGRQKRLAAKPLLKNVEPTEFLQGLSLLHTYERRCEDLTVGRIGKEVTAVSAKREHVLGLPLAAYEKWAERLTEGFFEADRFLRMEGFYHPKYLPYRSQIIPLAAAMVHLGDRWLEPVIRQKLQRWFWCGVLGELYGGAVETRIANDLTGLLAWIDSSEAAEPATVTAAGFQPSRLDTLRTRTSAAYRGIYILLQRQGSKDFFWNARMVDLDRDERKIEIHHIFPRAWCVAHKIEPKVFNSIINKTPISDKANRKIGGNAPSLYIQRIQADKQVQLTDDKFDEILKTHLIEPAYLRADQFVEFMEARKNALLEGISLAMGKEVLGTDGDIESPAEDADGEDEEDV